MHDTGTLKGIKFPRCPGDIGSFIRRTNVMLAKMHFP